MSDDDLPRRPTCRAECADVPRPCPYLSCRFHLFLDGSERVGGRAVRRLKLLADTPDAELDALAERWSEALARSDAPSCALDVAEDGKADLDAMARWLGVDRSTIDRMLARAWRRMGTHAQGAH